MSELQTDRDYATREAMAAAECRSVRRVRRRLESAGFVGASGDSRVRLVDDSLSGPFAVVLPAPAADARSKPAEARDGPPPETRLLVAVLDQAIDSLRKNKPQKTRRERRLYREVLDWLAQPDDTPFSFEYICTVLNLDPDYLRRGVLGSDWRRELARPLAAAR